MIYFDNAATTKPSEAVLSLFQRYSESFFANSSSRHALGREANKCLEEARNSILSDFRLTKTHKLVFLSGATEANNLAIKGICEQYKNRGKKIITSAVEHPSVLNVFRRMEQNGFEVVYLPVNEEGKVEPRVLEEAMDKNTILVSIMGINNETGTINNIHSLANIVHRFPKAFFHVDITQAIGKISLPYEEIDLFSFSGHKIHGLKGTGALLFRKNITLSPQNIGGDQEFGFRSGTVDMAGSCCLAQAVHLAKNNRQKNLETVQIISSYLREALKENKEIVINSPSDATPYILNFSFLHKKASVITEALSHEGIYVSSVSACHSKGEPVSYVLLAMGLGKERASNSMRISLSSMNELEEAKIFIAKLNDIIERTIDR